MTRKSVKLVGVPYVRTDVDLIWHSVFVPIMDTVTGISNHVVVAVLLPGICTEFAVVTNVTNAITVPILLAWVRHLGTVVQEVEHSISIGILAARISDPVPVRVRLVDVPLHRTIVTRV